jgi:hypothetical protein
MSNIVAKIKKLLALANDEAATENEAAVALAKARQLMLDNHIEDLPEDAPERVVAFGAVHEGMTQTWMVYCGIAAARLYGCKLMTFGGRDRWQLVGTQEKMQLAEMTYDYLVGEIEKRYKLALRVLKAAQDVNPRIRAELRQSFKNAAAQVIMQRVQQIIAAQATPSNARALVVVDQDAAAADQLLKDRGCKTKAVALKSEGIGTFAGREAGKSIQLQDTVA